MATEFTIRARASAPDFPTVNLVFEDGSSYQLHSPEPEMWERLVGFTDADENRPDQESLRDLLRSTMEPDDFDEVMARYDDPSDRFVNLWSCWDAAVKIGRVFGEAIDKHMNAANRAGRRAVEQRPGRVVEGEVVRSTPAKKTTARRR